MTSTASVAVITTSRTGTTCSPATDDSTAASRRSRSRATASVECSRLSATTSPVASTSPPGPLAPPPPHLAAAAETDQLQHLVAGQLPHRAHDVECSRIGALDVP